MVINNKHMDKIKTDIKDILVNKTIETVDTYTAKEVETKTIITETVIDLESLARDIEATQSDITGLEAYKAEEISARNADITRFTQIQDEKIAESQARLVSLNAKVLDLKSKGIQEKPLPVEEVPVEAI